MSDQQRNQILGHARSDTFLKHYISTHVFVDVQAIFLGTASKADLIKELGKLCLRRDPHLPKRLSDQQKREAYERPDIIQTQRERAGSERALKDRFGCSSKARGSPEGEAFQKIQSKLQGLKRQAEREAFSRTLRDFHSVADLEHMVLQLKGQTPTSPLLVEAPFVLEERKHLAHDLFRPATEATFAAMVDAMARLCLLSEGKKGQGPQALGSQRPAPDVDDRPLSPLVPSEPAWTRRSGHEPLRADNAQPPARKQQGKAAKSVRLKLKPPSCRVAKTKKLLTPLTCLFCHGNPRRGRTQTLARSDSLRRHYRQVHFQYQVGPFPCPLQDCAKIIQDPDHFANHASTKHKSDLGARAIIANTSTRVDRPGQLPSFVV